MDQKPRLLMYSRKEMAVLLLLGVMVAIFAFTLGVHLGKTVGLRGGGVGPDAAPVGTVQNEAAPERQEITEQARGSEQAADETLNQALHDEVARTGIKLDEPKPVELPEKPKAPEAGATTLGKKKAASDSDATGDSSARKSKRAAGREPFTLQIGSFSSRDDANDRISIIKAYGLKPFLREAEVKGKGTWYRVFLGAFSTKKAAEEAGRKFKADQVIDSYIVAKLPPE